VDEDAVEDPTVLCCAQGVERAVGYEEPGSQNFSVAGCRIGGMPFVVG
jgi:hypothetical protein